MDYIKRSFQFALRILIKSPSFTVISVVALALGIGAVTTMFSVINGAIFKGLPFPESEELMYIKRWDTDRQPWNTSIPVEDFRDFREQQKSFTDIAGWFSGTVNVSYDNNPVRFTGARISSTWLDIIGAKPFIGRNFNSEEDAPGAPPALILGYNAWKTHYNGDTDVIGQSVRINGKLGQIIGVMPKDFSFPTNEEVWIPLYSSIRWSDTGRGDWSINVMGRLNDGVLREEAEMELTSFLIALAEEFPEINGDFRVGSVDPIAGELLGQQTIQMMWVMLAMGFFVLLIACANVANLLLARSTLRTKELAIRSSLGASRRSLIGQLLIESILLSILGSIGGIMIALWATKALEGYGQLMNIPFWLSFELDYTVLVAVTVITLIAGLISGIVPSIKASKVSVLEILKDDTRTGSSLKMGLFAKGMVIVQVAISCILLILTVLMMRSVQNINNTDLHFDTEGVFTARMGLFEGDYPTEEERHQFFTTLKRNIEANPQIKSVGLYGRYRWSLIGVNWTRVIVDGEEMGQFEDLPLTTFEMVSPQYFETLGVDLIAGREFTDLDTPDSLRVAVINQALAEALFPNENPIGKRFKREAWPQARATRPPEEIDYPWLTVVGIAPNMAAQGVGNQTGAEGRHYWIPMSTENTPTFVTVAATTVGDPMKLNTLIRDEVRKLDPNLPLYAVATPAKIVEEDTAGSKVIANIFKVFGAVAVFLASVGIYGIMSFSVNQRRIEFGIRSALGATGKNLLVLVMRLGLLQFTIGLVVGLVGAFFFARLLRTFLFGVSTQDPITYIVVGVIFTTVAISAILVPAKRAAGVHPAQALRYE